MGAERLAAADPTPERPGAPDAFAEPSHSPLYDREGSSCLGSADAYCAPRSPRLTSHPRLRRRDAHSRQRVCHHTVLIHRRHNFQPGLQPNPPLTPGDKPRSPSALRMSSTQTAWSPAVWLLVQLLEHAFCLCFLSRARAQQAQLGQRGIEVTDHGGALRGRRQRRELRGSQHIDAEGGERCATWLSWSNASCWRWPKSWTVRGT